MKLSRTGTELWGQAWVYAVSHSTSGQSGFRTSGGASTAYVYINSRGKLRCATTSARRRLRARPTMPAGSGHLVTLDAIINGTGSSLAVPLDGYRCRA